VSLTFAFDSFTNGFDPPSFFHTQTAADAVVFFSPSFYNSPFPSSRRSPGCTSFTALTQLFCPAAGDIKLLCGDDRRRTSFVFFFSPFLRPQNCSESKRRALPIQFPARRYVPFNSLPFTHYHWSFFLFNERMGCVQTEELAASSEEDFPFLFFLQ